MGNRDCMKDKRKSIIKYDSAQIINSCFVFSAQYKNITKTRSKYFTESAPLTYDMYGDFIFPKDIIHDRAYNIKLIDLNKSENGYVYNILQNNIEDYNIEYQRLFKSGVDWGNFTTHTIPKESITYHKKDNKYYASIDSDVSKNNYCFSAVKLILDNFVNQYLYNLGFYYLIEMGGHNFSIIILEFNRHYGDNFT